MERIVININGITFNMLPVEGGQFVMGATAEQHGEAYDNESPAHSVKLDGFYLGETVVTQTLWNAVMGDESAMGSELPVTGKNWNDCQSFIRRLNELTGRHFRLPTEAEWEFAARGGKRSSGYKYAGSNNLDEVAWYEQNSGRQVHPVKQKRANELGFYDMSGNVWEWCNDWYGDFDFDDEGDEKAVLNPKGPTRGSLRVVRGAGNAYYAQSCRVSCRLPLEPIGGNYANTGFRLALDENNRYEQPNGSATAANSGVNETQQSNPLKGGSAKNGNPAGAHAKGGKTGNGHYWKPTGGGSQRKKKKWPWIVAAVVALIVIIVAVSGGEEDNPPVIEPQVEVVEEKPAVTKKPTETTEQKISKYINTAGKLFNDNQLNNNYKPYDAQIGKLSEGWEALLSAEKLLENGIDSSKYEYNAQIRELKASYINHITPIYDAELHNVIGLMNHPNQYKDQIEQGKERIAQLERFSGIDEVQKKSVKLEEYLKK